MTGSVRMIYVAVGPSGRHSLPKPFGRVDDNPSFDFFNALSPNGSDNAIWQRGTPTERRRTYRRITGSLDDNIAFKYIFVQFPGGENFSSVAGIKI